MCTFCLSSHVQYLLVPNGTPRIITPTYRTATTLPPCQHTWVLRQNNFHECALSHGIFLRLHASHARNSALRIAETMAQYVHGQSLMHMAAGMCEKPKGFSMTWRSAANKMCASSPRLAFSTDEQPTIQKGRERCCSNSLLAEYHCMTLSGWPYRINETALRFLVAEISNP